MVRFADRASHTLYIEPEGLDSDQLYLNLQRHTVQRNAAWGTLWSRSDRPA